MSGKIASLNVSVATGVILYEADKAEKLEDMSWFAHWFDSLITTSSTKIEMKKKLNFLLTI